MPKKLFHAPIVLTVTLIVIVSAALTFNRLRPSHPIGTAASTLDDRLPPRPPGWSVAKPLAWSRLQQTRAGDRITGAAFVPGWNLGAVSADVPDPDPAAVFSTIAGSYTQIVAYDGCDAADPWKIYDPADPGGADLTAVAATTGFWIEMIAPGTLPDGEPLTESVDYTLCAGWNLIGYPFTQSQPVGQALASIAGDYDLVYGWNAAVAPDGWDVFAPGRPNFSRDLGQMQPGRGYWIYAVRDTTLTINPPPADITLPTVTVEAAPDVVDPGATVFLTVDAADNATLVDTRLTVNGTALPLDANGSAQYVPMAAGLYTATAEAEDASGNIGRDTTYFRARTPADDGPPAIALDTPLADAIITTPISVTGTAQDSDLVYYDLEAAPVGTAYTRFSRGFTTVTAGPLGTLDPGAFIPGLYDIRVCAEDTWGNRACSAAVRVDLNAQNPPPGVNRVAFLDGAVDAAGLPVVVRRVYDSRHKQSADFGTGWTLEFSEIRLNANRIMGDDWEEQVIGSTYYIVETAPHRVTVSLPDGSFYRFNMRPSPQSSSFVPIQFLNGVIFDPVGNTEGARLTALDVPATLLFDGLNGLITTANGTLYSPNRYRLTLADGTKLIFARDGAYTALSYTLSEIIDPHGNRLTLGTNGITHTSGASIGFERDLQGRIVRLTDGNGMQRTYTYDDRGDLVATTDFDGYTTQFVYDDNHNLLQIIDPRGAVPGTLIYDDQNRIVAVLDAEGNETALDYAPGRQRITDPLGNVTTLTYDADGNLVGETDPLGHTVSYTYDANGNLTSRTNPLGHTTSYTYDANGNLLTLTDALGHTTTFTYDNRNNVLSRTDALGRTTTYAYDGQNNLTALTDALGHTTTYTYDAQGNRTTVTDPLGHTTTYTYDGQGRLTAVTDPLGHIEATGYDGNGRVLTESETVTTPGGPQTVALGYTYDATGRLTALIDPLGNAMAREYRADGRVDRILDRAGVSVSYTYTADGRRNGVTLRDGRALSQTFDPRGLIAEQELPDGVAGVLTYDAAGRPIAATVNGTETISRTFDAAGNVTAFTDASGNTIAMTYDALGRQTAVTENGATRHFAYDAVGNLLAVTEPNGDTITYSYDALNRRSAMTLPDGTTITYAYDAAGRLTAKTDPLGRTTTYAYDAIGNPIRVTDPLGQTSEMAYDERRRLIGVTDPLSRTTTFEYDANDQLIARTLPSGDRETYVYDANGGLTAYTSFTGDIVHLAYDSAGRVISRTLPGAAPELYTYDARGNLAALHDATGTTTLTYDARNRLAAITDPTGATISYTYDSSGNVITRTLPSGPIGYTYDSEDRVVAVNDGGDTVRYAYDDRDRMAAIAYPNGITTTITYDDRGLVAQIATIRADGTPLAQYDYAYDAAGRRIVMNELDGTVTQYAYDAADRLIGESTSYLGEPTGAITYTYDAAGNRASRTDGAGTTTYTYDVNDRLLTAGGASFAYDAAGNLTSRVSADGSTTYTYDALNRLIGVATPTSTITYTYNAADHRVRQSADGVETYFLIDPQLQFPEIAELRDGDGATLARFVTGRDQLSLETPAGKRFYHFDAQHTVRLLTDPAGAVTDTYQYDAFGRRVHAGAADNPLGYNSEWHDATTGFQYLRARYYDPALGRFVSADRALPALGQPSTLNRYVYALNNPLQYADPSGRFSVVAMLNVSSISTVLTSMQVTFGEQVLAQAIRTIGIGPASLAASEPHGVRLAVNYASTGNMGFTSITNVASHDVVRFNEASGVPSSEPIFYGAIGMATSGFDGFSLDMGASLDFSVEVGHVFNCMDRASCYEGVANEFGSAFSIGALAAGHRFFSGISPGNADIGNDRKGYLYDGARGYGYWIEASATSDIVAAALGTKTIGDLVNVNGEFGQSETFRNGIPSPELEEFFYGHPHLFERRYYGTDWTYLNDWAVDFAVMWTSANAQ